jgi:hypothetical protein
MVQSYRFAERAKDCRVDTDDVPCTDGVHADSAFLPKGIFPASAMNKTIGKFFAGCFADILSQRQGRAAWSIFFEAMVLLDYLCIILIAEHQSELTNQ